MIFLAEIFSFSRKIRTVKEVNEGYIDLAQTKVAVHRCFSKSVFTDVFQNFAIFSGKNLCWSLFLIKLQAFRPLGLQLYEKTPTQVFSCEF